MRQLLALFISLWLSLNGVAATWYIDPAASGANNGTSWANAWQSFAAANAASGASLSAGDTVYISGGSTTQTYTIGATELLLAKDGTSGARILIQIGQDAGHNGVAIFDGANTAGTNRKAMNLYNYNTVSGKLGDGSDGIRHFKFTNWVCSVSSKDIDGGCAVWGSLGCKFEYCEIATAMNGIYANVAGLEVSYCYLHDIQGGRGIQCTVTALAYDNVVIHHNTIETNGDFVGTDGGPDGIKGASGMTVYDNIMRCVPGTLLSGEHPDGLQLGDASSYNKIYNNYFANWINSGVKIGSATTDQVGWSNNYIWNNIFCIDIPESNNNSKGIEAGPDAVALTGVISNQYFCHNTFIDMGGLGITAGAVAYAGPNPIGAGPSSISNWVMENNLFFNCGRNAGGIVLTFNKFNLSSGWTLDYNGVSAGTDGGTTITVGDTPSSQPTYSPSHARTTAPTFVSYTIRTTGNNLHLATADTGARGQGIDLSGSYAAFGLDKDAVARTTFDLGAYQYNGAAAPTSSPNRKKSKGNSGALRSILR